jgi:hypothetical protein
MDPKTPGFMAAPGAPGSAGSAYRLPGARNGEEGEAKPRLDEHLVQDETREEMVRGRRVQAQPARPPHADRHFQLDYVIGAHVAPGYIASTDLLTRAGKDSEFATDTSVRRAGIDPETNTRYLEELAFEVVSTQSLRDITERAEDLCNRGVRRLIAIFVKKGEVRQWSAQDRQWISLPFDGTLEDPTLTRPVAIRALLDAAVADDEVAAALLAKRNPVLVQHEAKVHEHGRAEGRTEGRTEGRAEGRTEGQSTGLTRGIEAVCDVLGIPLGPTERAQMHGLDVAGLEALLDQIKATGATGATGHWPAGDLASADE